MTRRARTIAVASTGLSLQWQLVQAAGRQLRDGALRGGNSGAVAATVAATRLDVVSPRRGVSPTVDATQQQPGGVCLQLCHRFHLVRRLCEVGHQDGLYPGEKGGAIPAQSCKYDDGTKMARRYVRLYRRCNVGTSHSTCATRTSTRTSTRTHTHTHIHAHTHTFTHSHTLTHNACKTGYQPLARVSGSLTQDTDTTRGATDRKDVHGEVRCDDDEGHVVHGD